MRVRTLVCISLASLLIASIPISIQAQEPVSTSQVWFGKARRAWFPERVPIHGEAVPTTRVRCSTKDISHFESKAGKADIGFGPAFQIEGTVELNALPSELSVMNGSKGKQFMLLLQGYLFSPKGGLLWSQQGNPQGSSWVSESGSSSSFTIIGEYSGSVKGCTAAILAIGNPVLTEGTSETRVILGMKRFSFKDERSSSSYDPSLSRPSRKAEVPRTSSEPDEAAKKTYSDLRYVEKKAGGWKYKEVSSIPEEDRKKIFYELVQYQDKTGDDEGAYKVIGRRYGLPDKAVTAIVTEGIARNWPIP